MTTSLARSLVLIALASALGCGSKRRQPEPAPAARVPSARLVRIDPPAAPGALGPSLSARGDHVWVSFVEKVGPGADAPKRIRAARFAAGRWSEPTTIAQGPDVVASWADFPIVVESDGGTLYAAWTRTRAGEQSTEAVVARSLDGGLTWLAPVVLHPDASGGEHGFAALLADGTGARAFWLDGPATEGAGATRLRTSLVSDAVGEPTELDERACDCCSLAPARAGARVVVAYRDRDEREVRDISVVRGSDAGWSRPSAAHADGWVMPGCPVNGPRIAADRDTVVLAWLTGAPVARVLSARSNDAGARFGAPVVIDDVGPLGRVDVALAPGGDAVVAWVASAPGAAAASVRVRRVAADGRVGNAVEVARTTASRESGFPRIAVLGDRLAVAWVEPGEPSRLRAALVRFADLPAATGRAPRSTAPAASALVLGSELPAYRARDLDGALVDLQRFRGKPLVVSFFASWCAPCVEEVPVLSRLRSAHAAAGLAVVGISIEDVAPVEVRRFARRNQMSYTVLVDADDRARAAFGVPPLPATFVYDSAGRLVWRAVGAPDSGALERAVARVVAP